MPPSLLLPLLLLLLLHFCIVFQSSIATDPRPYHEQTDAVWPYKGRRWIVGGQFSEVYNPDGGTVAANNIAIWTGSQWVSMGHGTNGAVNKIFVDPCRNTYVVGQFTHVNGTKTGPFAWWKTAERRWEPMGTGAEWDFSYSNRINDVTAFCHNMPGDPMACNCDVYIGGRFRLTPTESVAGDNNENKNSASRPQAVNVARWISAERRWDAMGGVASHGLDDNNGEVFALFNENIDTWSYGYKLVVGGSFKGCVALYDVHRSRRTHEWHFVLDRISNVPCEAHSVLVQGDGEAIFAGTFTLPTDDGPCENICSYDWLTDELGRVFEGDVTLGDGAVISVDDTPFGLAVAGNFTSAVDHQPYIFLIDDGDVVSPSHNVSEPILDMHACTTTFGCDIGSMAFVGAHTRTARLFDIKTGRTSSFGRGTNGHASTISSYEVANFLYLGPNGEMLSAEEEELGVSGFSCSLHSSWYSLQTVVLALFVTVLLLRPI